MSSKQRQKTAAKIAAAISSQLHAWHSSHRGVFSRGLVDLEVMGGFQRECAVEAAAGDGVFNTIRVVPLSHLLPWGCGSKPDARCSPRNSKQGMLRCW